MQIQVINDQDRDIAIAEIRRLNAVMAQFGEESRTVYAEAYAPCPMRASRRFGGAGQPWPSGDSRHGLHNCADPGRSGMADLE